MFELKFIKQKITVHGSRFYSCLVLELRSPAGTSIGSPTVGLPLTEGSDSSATEPLVLPAELSEPIATKSGIAQTIGSDSANLNRITSPLHK